jgi:hypothetical protein
VSAIEEKFELSEVLPDGRADLRQDRWVRQASATLQIGSATAKVNSTSMENCFDSPRIPDGLQAPCRASIRSRNIPGWRSRQHAPLSASSLRGTISSDTAKPDAGRIRARHDTPRFGRNEQFVIVQLFSVAQLRLIALDFLAVFSSIQPRPVPRT